MANFRADRPLPTGTITWLFSDIEGSTRLWEAHPATMPEALAHHDAILRDAIEANAGCLVKTTGDGAVAAFASATDAVAASLAAQRALQARAWGELRIKSRMALHSGAAEVRDGDYHGSALNRAARLMAAGHGGQILVSLATAQLVRDQLPPGVALRDLGERRLKDLIRPERIHQVIARDLPEDFPPLETLDARPNNLPAQTTPFIGREDALREVKEKLADADVRLLTLSGVGGTGKTRLALQVAADLADAYEHGVFFVALAVLSDPTLVVPTIAQAFDVREAAGRRLQEQLQDYLREKHLLLVLDNFEQVIDAAPRVSELLAAAPRLKVLVTSREVMRLSGETDYAVPPLTLPDPQRLPPLAQLAENEAVALFVDRAMAVKPGFTIGSENAPAIAAICHRLDGLPLAIELAAARVRVLPPQRLLAELGDRLRLLTGGARDLPSRQKTLRGAIDWSHELLTGAERQLFRRLAVFVGGGTLEAIEAVCNGEGELPILATLESLVGKSLVRPTEADGDPRFTMLETIREYAWEKLVDAGESERLRERHRDCFLALAEEADPKLTGAEQAVWLHRLDMEHENFRASLEWSLAEPGAQSGLRLCGALQRFWWTRGHLSEGRQWCARILGKAGAEGRTLARAKTLNGAGLLAYWQGDYPAARVLHAESLSIRQALGDRRGDASSRHNLAMVAKSEGDYAAAKALYQESLAIKRELGDLWGMAATLNNLGSVVYEQGDYPASKSLHEESLAIVRALGDRMGIAASLSNLGELACDQGDYGAAGALHREGLAIRRDVGDRRAIAFSLEGLAAVAAGCGDSLRAASLWGAAARLRNEIGSPMAPNDRPGYDRRVAAARAAARDDVAFDRTWKEGGALTLEEAMDLALKGTREQE